MIAVFSSIVTGTFAKSEARECLPATPKAEHSNSIVAFLVSEIRTKAAYSFESQLSIFELVYYFLQLGMAFSRRQCELVWLTVSFATLRTVVSRNSRSGVLSSVISHVSGCQSQRVAALISLGSDPASPLSIIRRGYGRSSALVSTSMVGGDCSR